MSEREDQVTEFDREFEERLAQAMRRIDAPEGFAERAVERVRAEEAKRRGTLLMMPGRRRVWMSGALAAGLAVGVFGVAESHVRHEREKAARAQQQFEAGIRITDRALDHAREQLHQAGVRFGD